MHKILSIVSTTYNSSRYLEKYCEGITRLEGLESFRVILVMNAPDETEQKIIQKYAEAYPDVFTIVNIPERERISVSINRAFQLVDTEFCSWFDADDLRVPDSYMRQIALLKQHPEVDVTYGDFLLVENQGDTTGQYFSAMEFDEYEFKRGCHASPTPVFRTSLLKKIGGFDEQMKSGGDFDFHVRAAFNGTFKKTPGLLYYYTSNAGSASRNILQPIERTFVELRYGSYDRTEQLNGYIYVSRARKYCSDKMLLDGKWIDMNDVVPGYADMMNRKLPERLEFEQKYKHHMCTYYLSYPFKRTASLTGRVIRHIKGSTRSAIEI